MWQDHPLVALDHFALMRVLLLRLAAALPIAAFIAIAISLLSQVYIYIGGDIYLAVYISPPIYISRSSRSAASS